MSSVSDDRPLDEFFEDATANGDDRHERELQATFAWSPTPAACTRCGTATEQWWRDGEVMVCSACVEW